MRTIKKVRGTELLDSRGTPTVAAEVTLSSGVKGFAISPSGASTGAYEAYELRDSDAGRFSGKGTLHAAANVSGVICEALCGLDASNQQAIDSLLCKLDGTLNKSNLGANAILATSLSVADAAAKSYGLPLYRYIGGLKKSLPCPMMNILNGGAHAKNNIDIQEFMIVPIGFECFSERLRAGAEIYKALGGMLVERGLSTGVGDEGGFAPSLENDEVALELLCAAINKAGYNFDEVKIALDVAASEWYRGDGLYFMPKRGIELDSSALIKMYKGFSDRYPLLSVEDGLGEDDWSGWQLFTEALRDKMMLVGDDLFVTNKTRLSDGIRKNAGNTILIKPNQIGTLSETLEVMELAAKNGYKSIVSHRSGESEDTFIADLSVGASAQFIKTGAPARSERVAKYNRLLMIEKDM